MRLCALGLAILFSGPAAAVDIQEVISPGGIKGWLVEERSIPFAALEIRFRGGGSLDRPGKRGAVNLMTALLEEGAGDLDAQEFASERDALAAGYGFDVHRDALSVSATFLTENRDEAVALLKSALAAPRFDEAALERVRGQVMTAIRSDDTDPDAIAARRFNALAFGDHPYATPIDGTIESVSALTREDIVTAHKDVIALDRVHVGAAGDITAEEFGTLVDTLLGDLPEIGAPFPGDAEILLDGGVTVVPFETPQSVAVFGHAGISRDDPEFFPAFVANHVLGAAGSQSRLAMEVREKRGLTYGIGAYLASFDLAQLVVGQVASANERMAEAIEVTRAEWARMAADGVTQDELDEAKAYLTGAYPLRFDSNRSIARILAGMQVDGLGLDYVRTRNGKVNAVTADDVRKVARRLYRLEDLHFVVAGQPVGLGGAD